MWWRFHVKDEEIESEDHRRVPVMIWLVSFFRETTLQGVPMLMKQPGVLKKLFWLLAIALCALGLQWELAAFFDKFLTFQANTAVSIQTARMLPFPAITICNNNPVTTDWAGEGDGTNNTGTNQTAGAANNSSTGSGGSGTTKPAPSPAPTPAPGPASGPGPAPGPPSGPGPAPGRKKRQAPVPMDSGGPPQQQPPPGGKPAPQRQNFASSMQTILGIQAKASGIPYENRSEAGHQLCDTILKAEYEGVELDINGNFSTWHWNSLYGNCFTFNAGYLKSLTDTASSKTWRIKRGDLGLGIVNSTQSGDLYGLYLLLNADVSHYLGSTTQIGWRVVIHNQTEMPFPEESGIFVAPGSSTRIGMSLNYIKRLSSENNYLYTAKYSDCVDEDELLIDDPRNAYSKMMEVSYTKSACLKTCYQLNVMKNCSCFDFNYPSRGSAFPDQYATNQPCLYSNTTLWECKLAVAQLYQNGDLKCECPDTCQSYSFDTQISHLKWPSPKSDALASVCKTLYDTIILRTKDNDTACVGNSYFPRQAAGEKSGIPKLAEKMASCVLGRRYETVDGDFEHASYSVGSNFAEVYIYYKDFNYQTVIESQNMEFPDLLAYMGGILGLFFGFTFLTLFEYIQLAIDLIVIGVSRLCCRNNQTSDAEQLMMMSPNGSVDDKNQYNGVVTRRRSMHLKNQLRPGSVPPAGDAPPIMPPVREMRPTSPHYQVPFIKFNHDPSVVGMTKKY